MTSFALNTFIFHGLEAQDIQIEATILPGLPSFSIVGLPNKTISESKERIRAALQNISISLPPKKIVISLSPAHIEKQGNHFDLPILCALACALNLLPHEPLLPFIAMAEISLNGSLIPTTRIFIGAYEAQKRQKGFICHSSQAQEAVLSGNRRVLGINNIQQLFQHFQKTQIQKFITLEKKQFLGESHRDSAYKYPDLADIIGQNRAKRTLLIASAGRHNLLMVGQPGTGKSLLAECLPGILPPMNREEMLEVSKIYSLNRSCDEHSCTEIIIQQRPFRCPHHTASTVALIGGGHSLKPGEITLAHNGVLFLDEFPEFSRESLEALRQPLEKNEIVLARANHRAVYPANIQLIAAMNPCLCGYFGDPQRTCSKAPLCVQNYQRKISGPLFDRFDLHIHMEISTSYIQHKNSCHPQSNSLQIRQTVLETVIIQQQRCMIHKMSPLLNSKIPAHAIAQFCPLHPEAQTLLHRATSHFKLSLRAQHRILRVARTIADLEKKSTLLKNHINEALSLRNHHFS